MNCSLCAPLLLACLLAGLAGGASAQDLGRLAHVTGEKKVTKTAPRPPARMNPDDRVQAPMDVSTGVNSGAEFTLGSTQGAVVMGPESDFGFRPGVFDRVTGLATKLDFEIYKGIFRFAIAPPRPGGPTQLRHAQGEVTIRTLKPPAPPIRLYGTDVYLHVEQGGTTYLYVAEGLATVGELEVRQGRWTVFGPNQPPKEAWPLDPGRDGPEGPELPWPLQLDLELLRLDLPK